MTDLYVSNLITISRLSKGSRCSSFKVSAPI